MIDHLTHKLVQRPLGLMARLLARTPLSANCVTVLGFLCGVCAWLWIAFGYFLMAAVFIVINRILDGLDGALAHLRKPSDNGGFLDITLDFIFYAGVPFAFAVFDPMTNGLVGCFLVFSFMATASSFLAYSIISAKKRKFNKNYVRPKSIYYLGGLVEGSETVIFFLAIVLFPRLFPLLAWIFGTMCLITACTRVYLGYQDFKD